MPKGTKNMILLTPDSIPYEKVDILALGEPPHCLTNRTKIFQIPDPRTIFLKRQDIVSKKVGFIKTDFLEHFCAK